jgi:hypothetical protein
MADTTIEIVFPALDVTWSGRFVDSVGTALPGMSVVMYRDRFDNEPAESFESGPDGRFSVGPFAPFSPQITSLRGTDPSGRMRYSGYTEELDLTRDILDEEIRLPAVRDVQVRTFDSLGNPLPAAVRTSCTIPTVTLAGTLFAADTMGANPYLPASMDMVAYPGITGSEVTAPAAEGINCTAVATAPDHVSSFVTITPGDTTVSIVLQDVAPPPGDVTWSGRFVDSVGTALPGMSVVMYRDRFDSAPAVSFTSGTDGAFSAGPRPPFSADYLTLNGIDPSGRMRYYALSERVDLTSDVLNEEITLPTVRDVQVRTFDAQGNPMPATIRTSCNIPSLTLAGIQLISNEGDTASMNSIASPALVGAEVTAPAAEGIDCAVGVITQQGGGTFVVRATESDVSVVVIGSYVYRADQSNDGDNVADVIEMLGPNGGDGNLDGVPDNTQVNVTSLPVNGGELGSGQYLTVAVAPDVELTNVFTLDPANSDEVATPPPTGVTLPEGLAKFTVSGIEKGSDQTISIYSSSTESVTGYAKYNTTTHTWSVLPADRFAKFDDRIEIRLTDGGVGDADGVANGSIDDPGGLAVLTYRMDGFAQPINDPALLPNAAMSVFKAGSTIPVKFQLKNADGTLVTPADAPRFTYTAVGTTGTSVNESTPLVAATSGTEFRYADGWWHYNWKTAKADAGREFEIGARLDDGTTRTVTIGLR